MKLNKIQSYAADVELEIEVDADRAGNVLPYRWRFSGDYTVEMSQGFELELSSNFDGRIPMEINAEIHFDYEPPQQEVLHPADSAQPGFPAAVTVYSVSFPEISTRLYSLQELIRDLRDYGEMEDQLEKLVWEWVEDNSQPE